MTVEEHTFAKFRGKPVLLDSNLLLLLMIGSFNPVLIAEFKRTAQYSIEHYKLLVHLLGYFSGVVTTPHILTEVNSLANSLPQWIKLAWSAHFGKELAKLEERYQESENLRLQSGFVPFGLADSAIQQVSATTLLLTDDRRLAGYLLSIGQPVLNFDDLFKIGAALRA